MHETPAGGLGLTSVRTAVLAFALAACGSAAPIVAPPGPGSAATAGSAVARPPDPDLESTPAEKLLRIDWATVPIATDADALALWLQIAPTGADWDRKLDELPAAPPLGRALAKQLLRAGNVSCQAPPPLVRSCVTQLVDIPEPAPTATFDDPCLRRVLALWAFSQLEAADLPEVHDALRALAALPPPESELVAAAIGALPEGDQDGRLELIGIAAAAGQLEIANRVVGSLDEAHLILGVTRLHLAGALEILSAAGDRATYLTAITDEKLPAAARTQAITELVGATDTLAPDARAALVTAAASPECAVAARAAKALADRGEGRFVPRRPAGHTDAQLMRSLCVLASFERLQGADEASLLPGFLPAKGLERDTVTFDPSPTADDSHLVHAVDLVPRAEAVLPDLEDLVRALRHCVGTSCSSAERDYRFTWKRIGPGGQPLLTRMERQDRPPC